MITPPTPTATLLITCRDAKGIVAAVSAFVLEHGGNIVHADQEVDAEAGLFLQRVEFEVTDLDLSPDRLGVAFEPIAERFGMHWSLHVSGRPRRIALLASRQAHCMMDLLARWRTGELQVEIPLIISNHPDLEGLARQFDVPYRHLPVDDDGRDHQEAQISALLFQHDVELVVLARYMQVLSSDFVGRYPDQIINIHHSFLPAFPGAHPYGRAHARGVKVIGATAHYVTADLDQGPIIEQDVTRVSHRDSVNDLIRKGRDLERVVLARAVRLHLENRILVYGNKTVVFD